MRELCSLLSKSRACAFLSGQDNRGPDCLSPPMGWMRTEQDGMAKKALHGFQQGGSARNNKEEAALPQLSAAVSRAGWSRGIEVMNG